MQDKIFEMIKREEQRQKDKIGLIPSENNMSVNVSKVLSTCLSNKYSEGYSNRRYYEGNQIIDEIETLAIERIKKLFGVPYVNVQPYSGSPANSAIEFALMEAGDTIMGLKLSSGGHLTHGHPKVTFSGKFFKSVQFGLNKNARIDFDEMEKLAKKYKPKVIIAGTTAYPFILDFKKFRKVADMVGAWLVADISHITGLVIAGEHPSPVKDCDVVMSTTHKTFRGPRGAMIMVTKRGLERDKDLGKKINSAIIPGLQGGPHNATTAGIAVAAKEASKPSFRKYGSRIVKNAKVLAESLMKKGIKLVGDGTDTHLMVLDLTDYSDGLGTQVAYALDVAGIYANRNTIPNEPVNPFYPSGLRIGTPLVTTRGMKAKEMRMIADWIYKVVEYVKDCELPKKREDRNPFVKDFKKKMKKDKYLLAMAEDVKKMARKYPMFKE
jgi:glycine hydroxymethyltransferase